MLKYVDCDIVFQEVPNEVALAISISGCPCHCPGCHSPYLWQDVGEELTPESIDQLIATNGDHISCVALMGGDGDPVQVDCLAQHIHHKYQGMHVAWYSGRTVISRDIDVSNFDYIKIGPYIRHLGALKHRTTNQRLYRICDGRMQDITSTFWR
ncbi:MAG: anaerobic ribonucleoside-triphosphate reductase activating protein [Bacteroidaceae bacterium]|nr:anaerobic ribonucleoside-triphosphate reductase activating protein [Bacteroidaceae bacterium]